MDEITNTNEEILAIFSAGKSLGFARSQQDEAEISLGAAMSSESLEARLKHLEKAKVSIKSIITDANNLESSLKDAGSFLNKQIYAENNN